MFSVYFKIGIHHILDIYSYDHLLFLICLTAVYLLHQWKQILILITAFTLGHTTSLILATFHLIKLPSSLIEVLIPVTIIFTGLWNIISIKNNPEFKTYIIKYLSALFFGLIHGLGFSNYLQSLLYNEKNIITALFAFNVGIEIGQIFVVIVIMFLNIFIINILKLNRRDWINIFSGAGIGIAITLIINRLAI